MAKVSRITSEVCGVVISIEGGCTSTAEPSPTWHAPKSVSITVNVNAAAKPAAVLLCNFLIATPLLCSRFTSFSY